MKLKYLSVLAIGLVLQLSRVQAQELLTLQQAIKFALENKADAKNPSWMSSMRRIRLTRFALEHCLRLTSVPE